MKNLMLKVLLIGTDGQLGQELKQTLIFIGKVLCINRKIIDLALPDNIHKGIQEIKPDLIVNAAAYTAVDKSESKSNVAFAINEIASTIKAEESKKFGTFFFHISTDMVS
jgi:dTDP-4-dehydrorhamnose reductase